MVLVVDQLRQPQLNKAAKSNELEEKGDRNPKEPLPCSVVEIARLDDEKCKWCLNAGWSLADNNAL